MITDHDAGDEHQRDAPMFVRVRRSYFYPRYLLTGSPAGHDKLAPASFGCASGRDRLGGYIMFPRRVRGFDRGLEDGS